MLPNSQLCCMFSVSLYERYSSFTASTGSVRSNFIDELAEPECARAPRGVGSHTRDIREHAVKLQEATESMYTASLANGVWFSRGWTLQQSLVPPTLVFYMQANPKVVGAASRQNAMCYTGNYFLSQQTFLASHERSECT
ncbi:hypothetical protein PISMIDRAFT_690248 [Pisolithus microcarpus 441]|uniref:Uncharacterized protein n=1 Tax=Pisolithus microcarpus 441 TaxID=765257 RepID=A0A0C9YUQ7_9AGAM|nr:hypothetical protein PISMIDRAFT_690248 [Pisolithus microcarpus 441]